MTWKSCKLQALLLVLFAVSLAHAEKHSDGTASLSGVVIGASGAAVAVHLEPETQSTVRYYDGYEAVPREDGSFSFTEIPPGEYRLTVEANSFVPPIPSGPPGSTITLRIGDERARQQPGGFTAILPADLASGTITLHTGEERQGVVIELTHKLSICGYVTHDIAPLDAWGRRIGPPNIVPSDTSITYYHFNPEFGVLDNETKFDTNKDGSFRITDLAPGTYYVNSFGTWYPGTSDFTNPKPVLVGPEPYPACDMDLQQISHPGCTMGTVSGTIQPYLSSDKNSYTVSLVKRNPNGISANIFDYGVPVMVDSQPSGPEDNSFQARACPGDYDVVLSERQHAGNNLWGNAPTQKIVFDTQQVTIASSGSSHVTFTPHAMASIEGEVRLDMVTKDEFCPQCQAIYVSILREGNGEFQTVTLSSGNRFDFHNVSPGEYQIFVTATRLDKVFLQSIMVDGVEGKGNHFTIPDAKFVSMAATLSGNLTQAAGHPSPDVRHAQHWQSEGMRPSATVAGKIDGDSNATYTVRLLPIAFSSNAEVNLTTQAGADGSFHFDSVPPGIYRLRAHDKDYIRFDYGGKAAELRGEPLLISPGAQIMNLTLNAPQHGASYSICGHLTDTNGNSRSMRIWYRSTADLNRYQQSKEVSTDNNGYFRIDGLLAGDYFLQTPDIGRTIALSSNGQLYEAKPVHLEDGKNAGCGANPPLELHFPANGGSTHSISGAVSGDLPARLGDRFLVELEDSSNLSLYGGQYKEKLDADHKFNLENIPGGRYKLSVYGVYGPEPQTSNRHNFVTESVSMSVPYFEPLRHLLATQLITVSDQDITGLTLTQLTLPSVTGTVHIPHSPSNWKDFKPSSLSLKLVPHRKNGPIVAPIADKGENAGEFTIGAADAGEYEIQIEATDRFRAVNNVLYVASAKLNGKEVNPRFLTLPNDGVAKLDVELGSEFASVHAQVSPDTSFALPVLPLNERCEGTGHYGVALFPDPLVSSLTDEELKQTPQIFTAWSISDKCLTFMSYTSENAYSTLQNIPPGKYYAIAVGDRSLLSIAALIQGPITTEQRKLLNAFTSIAKPITLRPGENLEVKLTDKTIEANRIAARVGVADEQENLHPQNGQSCCAR
jgi:hypothetical protein